MCLLVLLFSASAHAATVDQAGANALKAEFEELLNVYDNAATAYATTLQQEGDLQVIPTDGYYYAITFPHLTLIMTEGGKIEIGTITINAMPTDSDKMWKTTMALPTPMIAYDEMQNPVMTFSIGSQKLAGIWHTEAQTFIKSQLDYRDLAIKVPSVGLSFDAASLTSDTDMTEESPDLYSGTSDMIMSNITMNMGGQDVMRMRDFKVGADMNGYSFEKMKIYQDKMSDLMASAQQGGSEAMAPEKTKEIMDVVFDNLLTAFKGFDLSMEMNDLNVTPPGGMSPPLSLGNISFAYGISDFDTNSAGFYFNLGHNGLNIDLNDELANALLALSSNLDVRFNALPMQQLLTMARETANKASAQPNAAQMHGMQAMSALPQMFTDAGTNMQLSNSHVTGEDYSVKYTGTVMAKASAAKQAIGNAQIIFGGLDEMIKLIQSSGASGSAAQLPPQLQQGLAMLSFVQMVGQQGNAPDGTPARIYNFELKDDGSVLLNGTDIMNMMGAQMGSVTAPQTIAPAAGE
jgi:hypothetical protein